MSDSMESLSQSIKYLSSSLSSYARNRFKISPSGASSALSPGDQMNFTLPAQSILDASTLRLVLDVTPTKVGVSTSSAKAILPPVTDLINSFECYIGGNQVIAQNQEYSTIQSVYGGLLSNSVDRSLSYGNAVQSAHCLSANGDKKQSLVWTAGVGLFAGEASSTIIPTSLTGDVLLRFTLSNKNVMLGSGTNLDSDVQKMSFIVNTVYLTIDTLTMGENLLESLLYSRIAESPDASIPITYKDHEIFSTRGEAGDFTHQFSLSTASLNSVCSVLRNGAYTQGGLPLIVGSGKKIGASSPVDDDVVGSSGYDAERSRFMFFESFTNDKTSGTGAWTNGPITSGNLRDFYSVANIQYPQFDQTAIENVCDCFLVRNRHTPSSRGNQIGSLPSWHKGKCVVPLVLCDPGAPSSMRTGVNTQGSSTAISLTVKGIDKGNIETNAPECVGITCTSICEVSRVLHIKGNRSVFVER